MVYDDNQMRERILTLIHRECVSQREFANKIGRIPSNISLILKGERKIPRGLGNEKSKAVKKGALIAKTT